MKTQRTLLSALIMLVFISGNVVAQNCAKKKFCEKEDYGSKFEYRSQTSYALLSPGDTARTSVVAYRSYTTRVLVCADKELGDVSFKVIESKRRTRRVIDKINEMQEEVPIYVKDEYGNPKIQVDEFGYEITDYDGNPMYEVERYETVVQRDTIWKVEKYKEEIQLFNSKSADKRFYEVNIDSKAASRRFIIEVVIPESEEDIEACVTVSVGRRTYQDGIISF